jgi:hypothetical protein
MPFEDCELVCGWLGFEGKLCDSREHAHKLGMHAVWC